MPLPKPKKKRKSYYDYHECRNYLQEKYKYDERNYAGRKFNGKKSDAPYLDFWHWVCDNHQISNGCFITFSTEQLSEIEEPWVREIYKHYVEEFVGANGELEMYVWW